MIDLVEEVATAARTLDAADAERRRPRRPDAGAGVSDVDDLRAVGDGLSHNIAEYTEPADLTTTTTTAAPRPRSRSSGSVYSAMLWLRPFTDGVAPTSDTPAPASGRRDRRRWASVSVE